MDTATAPKDTSYERVVVSAGKSSKRRRRARGFTVRGGRPRRKSEKAVTDKMQKKIYPLCFLVHSVFFRSFCFLFFPAVPQGRMAAGERRGWTGPVLPRGDGGVLALHTIPGYVLKIFFFHSYNRPYFCLASMVNSHPRAQFKRTPRLAAASEPVAPSWGGMQTELLCWVPHQLPKPASFVVFCRMQPTLH